MRLNRNFIPALILIVLAAFLSTSHATVITLAGGDAGEGFDTDATLVAAVDFVGATGTDTVQGVTFTGSNPNVVIGSSGAFGSTSDLPGASADDVALRSVLNGVRFNPTITVTVSNLNPSLLYQIDLLFQLGNADPDRTQQVTINSVITDTFVVADNNGGATLSGAYDVRNFVMPDSGGTINISIAAIAGDSNAIVNAIVVSVPEPSLAAGMMGTAGFLLIAARRRKSTTTGC